jgi:hypothetical protein
MVSDSEDDSPEVSVCGHKFRGAERQRAAGKGGNPFHNNYVTEILQEVKRRKIPAASVALSKTGGPG